MHGVDGRGDSKKKFDDSSGEGKGLRSNLRETGDGKTVINSNVMNSWNKKTRGTQERRGQRQALGGMRHRSFSELHLAASSSCCCFNFTISCLYFSISELYASSRASRWARNGVAITFSVQEQAIRPRRRRQKTNMLLRIDNRINIEPRPPRATLEMRV